MIGSSSDDIDRDEGVTEMTTTTNLQQSYAIFDAISTEVIELCGSLGSLIVWSWSLPCYSYEWSISLLGHYECNDWSCRL